MAVTPSQSLDLWSESPAVARRRARLSYVARSISRISRSFRFIPRTHKRLSKRDGYGRLKQKALPTPPFWGRVPPEWRGAAMTDRPDGRDESSVDAAYARLGA